MKPLPSTATRSPPSNFNALHNAINAVQKSSSVAKRFYKPSENNSEELLKDLSGFANYLKPVIPKLIAILQGERNTTLADDPELDYDDAAELLLLLEAL